MTAASYEIVGGNYAGGGSASRQLKEQLKRIGTDPAVIRRAMVAAYEAEMNVVIHARRGALQFRLENGQLEVEVTDEGPGIADVEQALRPGFSTASAQARALGFGAGMGLPNIKRNSDSFSIQSSVGVGTRLRFTLRLRSQALYGTGRHSVQVVAELCRQCYRCVHACPTGAVRLRHGRPEILDYACIDCTECIAVCPTGALRPTGTLAEFKTPEMLKAAGVEAHQAGATLVVHPAALTQFAPDASPDRVVEELRTLGFAEVVFTSAWHEALCAAVRATARHGDLPRPVIAPVCPAVVNLIEMRFPGLIRHLAPFHDPCEALRRTLAGRRLMQVLVCPCQRTTQLAEDASPAPEFVMPKAVRAALLPRLLKQQAVAAEALGGEAPRPLPVAEAPPDPTEGLRIGGIAAVRELLEQIEDGQVQDVPVIEPYACSDCGFGSPLLPAPGALASHRWRRALAASGDKGALAAAVRDPRARAVPREKPYAARPGLRLDEEMAKAVQKLGRIEKLRRELPGHDCGWCGAPTCATFAEDVVLGRAVEADCKRRQDPPEDIR